MRHMRLGTRVLAVVCCMSGGIRADDAAQTLIDDAMTVLAKAAKTPPKTDAEARPASAALRLLAKRKPEGLSKVAWSLASDARQTEELRSVALSVLGKLHDSPAEQVRALAIAVVKNKEATLVFRARAAYVFRNKRIADAGARAALEEVLLRTDQHIVQRTCLAALAETAKLERIRALLLRRELYAHPYFGIRIDVCTGLAALNVRTRPSLEILCTLIADEDDADTTFMVSQEAWLSFWTLTGRTHGIDDPERFEERPPRLAGDEARPYLWRASFLRPGVTQQMVHAVVALTHNDTPRVEGEDPRKRRNTRELRAVAEKSRKDIDAIVAEWEKKK